MDPAYQSPARQSKVIMQREYREKEQECFTALRDIIKELTGEELRTRQEILRKATEMLYLQFKNQEGAQVSALNAHEAHTVTNYVHDDMPYSAMGNFNQLPDISQNWYSTADFDAAMFYDGIHVNDEQHNVADNSASNQPSSQHGWDWSNRQH